MHLSNYDPLTSSTSAYHFLSLFTSPYTKTDTRSIKAPLSLPKPQNLSMHLSNYDPLTSSTSAYHFLSLFTSPYTKTDTRSIKAPLSLPKHSNYI